MGANDSASNTARERRTDGAGGNEGNGSDPDDTDTDTRETATRADPTRDLPPERFAGSESEWRDLSDEGRRIAMFSLLPVEDRDPSLLVPRPPDSPDRDYETTPDGVDAATCVEIRETMNDALTAREVVEDYPDLHTSKVMRHAYGECRHEVETPPTASPQIGGDECLAMRDDYRQGNAVSTIASEWARSENTVTRHIFGRCSHTPRPKGISPSDVTVADCKRIRATFAGNGKVSVREVAAAMRLREEVVATHLFDLCYHEGEDPGVPPASQEDADLWDGREVGSGNEP